MSKNVHIEHICDTEANVRANLDALQLGILSDQNEEMIYSNRVGSKQYYAAAQKYWDGAALTYCNADFATLTAHSSIYAQEYIKRRTVDDDYIRFENDKISLAVGGVVTAFTVPTYTQLTKDVAIGATVPTATLHVLNEKDVAAVTIFNLEGKRATPANDDTMYVNYTMNNSTPASFEYARTTITADDITAAAEAGSLLFEVARAGALEVCMKISPTEIVINEAGADRDYRVEAAGYPYALFVQGSDGMVGVGTSTPTATLHVLNTLDAAEVLIFKLEGKRDTPTNNDTIYIDYTMNNDTPASYEYARTTIIAEDITTDEEEGSLLFEVSRAGALETVLKMSATDIVCNEPGADRDFRVEAFGVVSALFVQGSDGYVGINDGTPTYQLDVNGTFRAVGAATFDSTLGCGAITSTGSITGNSFITASNIGIAADTDLIQLTGANAVTMNGALTLPTHNIILSTGYVDSKAYYYINGTKVFNVDGTANILLGDCGTNYTGSYGVGVGIGAMGNGGAGTSGSYNFFFGYNCGNKCTSGNQNIGIGAQCFGTLNTGIFNCSVGTNSSYLMTSARYNTAVGFQALYTIDSEWGNVGIGFNVGRYYRGQYSVLIGYEAGRGGAGATYTGANYNVCIGYGAGWSMITNQNNCVFIGNQAGYYETGDQKLFIDNTTRASEADGRVKALIYGVFNAATASQSVLINGYLWNREGLCGYERSSDPAQPAEGEYVIWMSDGTGKGDDGDIMIASTAGGTTNYGTLFDHSGGAAW